MIHVLRTNTLRYVLTIFLMAITIVCYASNEGKSPIVIVQSYNKEAKRMIDNIDAFYSEYQKKGGKKAIQVEEMNCGNLSEATEWEERLWSKLSKYYENGNMPAAVVLLGQEASSAFFSLTSKEIKATPVVIGLRSNNILKLPKDKNTDTHTWEPQPYYLDKDFKDYNIIGGYAYKQRVTNNIELINSLFPYRDSLVFLSDNTFGGVTLRAHFRNSTKNHPHYKVEFLDGRRKSFLEINNAIKNVKGNKTIIVGTWRVDSTETFTMSNLIVALGKVNKDIPAFSLTDTGLGDWTIGGYIPDYHMIGDALADDVIAYERTGEPVGLHMIDNVYKFDYEKLKQFNIKEDMLPDNHELINKPVSAFEEYKIEILSALVVFIVLVIALIISLHYLRKSKLLERSLIDRSHELEIARDKAEKANAMKSAFIANMSHEIRTPLNAVVGFSQLITDPEMPLTEEEKMEYGGYIKVNSDTLLNLVNDILQISKMDAKSMVFNIVDADMVELCKTGAESASTNLLPGVSIVTDLPDGPIPVQTDVLRLQQVFNNLLSNAKKFTEKGTITVAIEESTVPDEIRISVTDTGCGIPEDKADYVFQRFKQIDSFKQGTGLGLSITRSIIENLGGRIWLDTEYKNGARFVFTHPTHQN